ncbi:unnamed protein product [Ectocarpus sp. 12 AP-2014]
MMSAAFGDESASSMSLLPPIEGSGGDTGDDVGGNPREAAPLLMEENPHDQPSHNGQRREQQDEPGRQLMEDRWPSGQYSSLTTEPLDGAGGGSPNVAWQDPNTTASAGDGDIDGMVTPGQAQAGLASLDEQPAPDPFAMERPPIVNGGGGGAVGGEIRAKPPVVPRPARREWNLTTTKPSPKLSSTAVGATGAANGHISSDGEGVGAAGVGGGSVAGSAGVGLKPPKWLPDEDTASCSGCGRDFDWARRRHHCRLCGGIFCYACSQFRALLPRSFGSRDPQRLCQPCNARVAPLQEMLAAESVSNAVKENDVERGTVASYLNRPIVFTLGAEVRKAAYTIHNFSKEGMIQDQSIPQELLSRAKGLAFLTVIKGGFIIAGRVGTGLVISKTDEGVWSAPSAIATLGMGWGALVGGEITDFVLVLNTDAALEAFSGRGQLSIGAELSVAVGPVGRTGAGNVSVAAEGVAHAYSYSHSRGLFAGLSLEGGVIVSRPDVNRKFYGRQVPVRELLSGSVAPPPAARPLYEALDSRGPAADQQRLLSQGFRVG